MKRLLLLVATLLFYSLGHAQDSTVESFEFKAVTMHTIQDMHNEGRLMYRDSFSHSCIQAVELLLSTVGLYIIVKRDGQWLVGDRAIVATSSQFAVKTNFNLREECELLITQHTGQKEFYWLVNIDRGYVKEYDNLSEVILESTGW